MWPQGENAPVGIGRRSYCRVVVSIELDQRVRRQIEHVEGKRPAGGGNTSSNVQICSPQRNRALYWSRQFDALRNRNPTVAIIDRKRAESLFGQQFRRKIHRL